MPLLSPSWVFCPSAERLLKMTLEDLREFLQEKIAASLQYEDDAVIEQLQVSMSELRKMKFDLPPPGGQSPQPPDPLLPSPRSLWGL